MEVNSLMVLTKAQAGNDIYKRIKAELVDLFGKKPEEAYNRARNRIMTGKPSQLGKALVEDICQCVPKLNCPCCAKQVWGMYREAIPVVVRNHLAELSFTKDTYKQIFTKSDQVFDSNNSSQTTPGQSGASVSAVKTSSDQPEVAAVRPSRGGGQRGRGGKCGDSGDSTATQRRS